MKTPGNDPGVGRRCALRTRGPLAPGPPVSQHRPTAADESTANAAALPLHGAVAVTDGPRVDTEAAAALRAWVRAAVKNPPGAAAAADASVKSAPAPLHPSGQPRYRPSRDRSAGANHPSLLTKERAVAPKHLPGIKEITDAHIRSLMGEICPTLRVREIADGPHSYSNRLWRCSTDEGELLVRIPGRTTDSEVMRGTLVASRLARKCMCTPTSTRHASRTSGRTRRCATSGRHAGRCRTRFDSFPAPDPSGI